MKLRFSHKVRLQRGALYSLYPHSNLINFCICYTRLLQLWGNWRLTLIQLIGWIGRQI